jgi:DNA-binding transcriptional ArsR family regulator
MAKRRTQSSNLFRALMHPVRIAILEELRGGEACVCHLEAVLGYGQAYLLQQLEALQAAGLVAERRDGWFIYYGVTQPAIFELVDIAREIAGSETVPIGSHHESDGCPCPRCAVVREEVPV